MREVVVHPDAEKAVIDFLLPVLEAEAPGVGIDVRGGGGRFVRVRRVGGSDYTPNHDAPVVDLLVWHDDDLERMGLARLLWAYLRAAEGENTGDAVLTYLDTVLGPRQMPDPADDTSTVCMFTVRLAIRRA